MKILGIESTCDETGAAVVEDGRRIISNVVASSVDLQKKYGGVVPEVAAREQIKVIIPTIDKAVDHVSKESIDAIAISHGPGLIGSLLIGVETSKALALAWEKPLIKVNHLVGHIYANWISLGREPKFPLISLIVSGGHTDLVLMKAHGKFDLIGSTLDDSAGEAFDKVARLLGLGYPGGPEIEMLASKHKGHVGGKSLPRPMIGSKNFDFSFSGLKTAVVNYIRDKKLTSEQKINLAAEFQKAAADVLVKKTIKAAEKFDCKTIVLGGGVAANTLLRSQMTDRASRVGIKIHFPSKKLSVDNGAMIAAAAFYHSSKSDPLKLQADSGLHFT